jgi:hypothetical protein
LRLCSALQKALQQEGDQTDIDLEEMRLIEVSEVHRKQNLTEIVSKDLEHYVNFYSAGHIEDIDLI